MSAAPGRSGAEVLELLRRNLNDAGALHIDPVYGGGIVDWDRIRARDEPGRVDVALADIHLSADAKPGTLMPIEVLVQNRGTQWLASSSLAVAVNAAEPAVPDRSDGSGASTVRTVLRNCRR